MQKLFENSALNKSLAVWSTNFQLSGHCWPVIHFQKCSWTSFSSHRNSIIHTFSLQYRGRLNQDPIILIFNIERFTHFEHFSHFQTFTRLNQGQCKSKSVYGIFLEKMIPVPGCLAQFMARRLDISILGHRLKFKTLRF